MINPFSIKHLLSFIQQLSMLNQCHNCTVEYKLLNHKEQYKERDAVRGKSSDLGPCFYLKVVKIPYHARASL
ncbi:hypothetical protein VCR15J2_110026 [Vibrio coralliirubri]|nr:hypothetical protein VCR15J2_110026 [Vibrio coralliirubri]